MISSQIEVQQTLDVIRYELFVSLKFKILKLYIFIELHIYPNFFLTLHVRFVFYVGKSALLTKHVMLLVLE